MVRRIRLGAPFLQKPPMLISESADEFDVMQEALEREIKPRGFIEQMYVADISATHWEVLRLRRCKAVIIIAAVPTALANLLQKLLKEPGAGGLAQRWFTDPEAKKQISETLGQFGLNETAIEAEAIRMSSADLQRLDRMLASLESRRNKALRCIDEYRDRLARRLREGTDRIIEAKGVPRLEDASRKRSA
jgi:hypothetical protein